MASGMDRETAKEFAENLDTNLNTILEELKSKKYRA
jgi:retron-type reverse transcriptase